MGGVRVALIAGSVVLATACADGGTSPPEGLGDALVEVYDLQVNNDLQGVYELLAPQQQELLSLEALRNCAQDDLQPTGELNIESMEVEEQELTFADEAVDGWRIDVPAQYLDEFGEIHDSTRSFDMLHDGTTWRLVIHGGRGSPGESGAALTSGQCPAVEVDAPSTPVGVDEAMPLQALALDGAAVEALLGARYGDPCDPALTYDDLEAVEAAMGYDSLGCEHGPGEPDERADFAELSLTEVGPVESVTLLVYIYREGLEYTPLDYVIDTFSVTADGLVVSVSTTSFNGDVPYSDLNMSRDQAEAVATQLGETVLRNLAV